MCKEQGTCFALVMTAPVARIMCFYFTCLDEASVSSRTKHLANRFFAYEGNVDKIIYLILSITVRYQS
jgi:hypothetical protein